MTYININCNRHVCKWETLFKSLSQVQIIPMGHCHRNSMNSYISCDVIWENPAYGGANSAFQDQPFQCVYIDTLSLNCADSEKSVFCRCSYETKSPGSDQTPHRMCGVWSEPALFIPPKPFFPNGSISLLFISFKFVKGFLAITFLLLVISSWNFHDVCQRFLYNQIRNFSLIRRKTKIFPIDPHYKNCPIL